MELSKDIQERLEKINWDSLKEKYGISKEAITSNPRVASQLAYGQMTDLVYGSNKEISGLFSLRAYPQGEGKEWAVKIYTMEKSKSESDNITVYNQPITSEKVKQELCRHTSWIDSDGNKRAGLANANGGRPISLMLDGRKQECLVSIHQPTNRVVAMPVEQVKAYLFDKSGELRGRSLYGVKFSKEQAHALAEGRAVVINGLRKDGTEFKCCAQFDAAQRQVVPCHPIWFQEALRAGMDTGQSQSKAKSQSQTQSQSEGKEQKSAQSQAQEQQKTQRRSVKVK